VRRAALIWCTTAAIFATAGSVGCTLDNRILTAPKPSAAALACKSTAPPSPLITDFSDAKIGTSPTTGQPIVTVGGPPGLAGTFWTTALGDLSVPTLSLVTMGGSVALQIDVNPGVVNPDTQGDDAVSFGLDFGGCVDASAYSGVEFTVGAPDGPPPSACSLKYFGIQCSEDDPAAAAPGVGACDASLCAAPLLEPWLLGTQTVAFESPLGGAPDRTVDPAALTGLEWQVIEGTGDPCVTTLVLADQIKFVQ
jgi:hypothetical protein